jgi:cell division protein FtsW (lipid II flippase)
MSAQSIGAWSGSLVFLSVIPYAIRTYEGKIQPVPTTWSLWSLIGLAVLLTYRSSGAEANLWPAVFGFVNPVLITTLSVWRHSKWKKPSFPERLCFLFGVVSLAMWIVMRQNPNLAQYALYVAMAADVCAAIPTIVFVWKEPEHDRPLAWVIFAIGYFLAIFAIPQDTLANWIVPLYMTLVALVVAFPLALYRLRARVPLKHWA